MACEGFMCVQQAEEKIFSAGDWVALASVAVTLILGIITAIVSVCLSRKQSEKEYVTNSRQKWLNKLKELIAEFYGKIKYYEDKDIPDNNLFLDQLYYLSAQIKLQLNFNGVEDKNIVDCLDEIITAYAFLLHCNLIYQETQDRTKRVVKELQYLVDNYPTFFEQHASHMIKRHNLDDPNNKERLDYLCKDHEDETVEDLKHFSNNCVQIMKNYSELLLIYASIYSKVEWERIKVESVKGLKNHFNFSEKYDEYKKIKQDEINKILSQIKRIDEMID